MLLYSTTHLATTVQLYTARLSKQPHTRRDSETRLCDAHKQGSNPRTSNQLFHSPRRPPLTNSVPTLPRFRSALTFAHVPGLRAIRSKDLSTSRSSRIRCSSSCPHHRFLDLFPRAFPGVVVGTSLRFFGFPWLRVSSSTSLSD